MSSFGSKTSRLATQKSDEKLAQNDEKAREESELKFKQMLLDLVADLLHDLYLENYASEAPLFEFVPHFKQKSKKKHFNNVIQGPTDVRTAKELIKSKLFQIIKCENAQTTKHKKSKWRMQKRLDLIDQLLDVEMREQDPEWSNYDAEEYEAKIMIADNIFDMILLDTLNCFKLNELKRENRQLEQKP
jgi:hypothetical protein